MAERIVTKQYSDSLYFGHESDPNREDALPVWSWQCNATFSRDCGFYEELDPIPKHETDVCIESSEWRNMEAVHTAFHISRMPVILLWEGKNT